MAIDPKFIINLKGREYPTWPGVLDAATKAGLKSLTTRVIQVPEASNGHVAVVMARAEFEDGRVFEDVGDASPANCSAQIATAALRMASTRGKGRACRDAINVGQTMWEELPDDEKAQARNGAASDGVQQQGGTRREAAAAGQSRARGSSAPVGAAAGSGSEKAGSLAAGPDAAAVAPVTHFCSDCGVEVQGVTTGKGPVSAETVVSISQSRWGATLCHACGRKRMEVETANVPAGQIA